MSPGDKARDQHDRQEPSGGRQLGKKAVLTQHEPSQARETASAVVLKRGGVFLLSSQSGDVPSGGRHAFGLFYRDCRFLAGYSLELNGQQPITLSSEASVGYKTTHYLANDRIEGDGSEEIPKDTIAIRRERVIRGGVVRERITLANHGRSPAKVRLRLRFEARFEDIFEIKGFLPAPRGRRYLPPETSKDKLVLGCIGADGIRRTTTVLFDPVPGNVAEDGAAWETEIQPRAERSVSIGLAPVVHDDDSGERTPSMSPCPLERGLERSQQMWLERNSKVSSSNRFFERAMRRALLDLQTLRSSARGLHYFAAGVPWFVTLFGRDSIIAAIQTLPYQQSIAAETLRLLATFQARHGDAYRDAEPGKMLHELRRGELAHLGAIPQSPAYYGTVDATPLFLVLLAEYVAWSGDLDIVGELRQAVDAALGWMANSGDHDGDGYLDYEGEGGRGLVNQGWKDSGNAIVNADGSQAVPPIALCEVQGYAYRAWRQTAWLLRAVGDAGTADELDGRAARLRERFERDFWSESLGCYVLARQKDGRPAEVVASNAGQVLWGGIAGRERARAVCERLLREDMFAGWGVRTLSSDAVRYNPVSYHLGSVWPHDNGLILAGFCRYGFQDAALRILDGLFHAAIELPDFRLPELFCGYSRREGGRPVNYPVASRPQAWAAGALPHALWNVLGLRPDALRRQLTIRRPRLPDWLEHVDIRDVPIGDARVDLSFEREGDGRAARARWQVRSGHLEVGQDEDVGVAGAWD